MIKSRPSNTNQTVIHVLSRLHVVYEMLTNLSVRAIYATIQRSNDVLRHFQSTPIAVFMFTPNQMPLVFFFLKEDTIS